jgi:hypothetical protein
MPRDTPSPSPEEEKKVGLCARCQHARRIVSAKGSVFWLCRLSETSPRFRKYPPLPVVACEGHESGTPG